MKDSPSTSKKSLVRRALLFLVFLVTPTLAQAHPQIGCYNIGFGAGLAHPITGLDHICAMVAIGLWAAQRGGRSLWAVPLAFVSVMALGGVLGAARVKIQGVESGIAASVLILGVLIAASVRLPLLASMLLVGLLAFFHGHAHGSEMPATASGMFYGIGFIISTMALHLCGIGVGVAMKHAGSANLVRFAGGVIAICGVYLFICI